VDGQILLLPIIRLPYLQANYLEVLKDISEGIEASERKELRNKQMGFLMVCALANKKSSILKMSVDGLMFDWNQLDEVKVLHKVPTAA
jgi:hypothetical protein